jgi:hypothetical protein
MKTFTVDVTLTLSITAKDADTAWHQASALGMLLAINASEKHFSVELQNIEEPEEMGDN